MFLGLASFLLIGYQPLLVTLRKLNIMHLKTWTFAASLLWAGFGHATPITDYNLILFGDYNFQGGDIFAQNNSLKLDHGDASTVIINVAGSEINVGGGVNLTEGFGFYPDGSNIGARNILWNFFEAVSIDFGNTGMVGSVLAPWAKVSGGNNFDGTLVAQSYTGGREFHDFSFIPPTTSVNEPPLWLLALLGLALIGTARRFAPAPTRQGDEA